MDLGVLYIEIIMKPVGTDQITERKDIGRAKKAKSESLGDTHGLRSWVFNKGELERAAG